VSGRIFGTDGIRGRAGEGWLEAERVARLGQAIGEVVGLQHQDGARHGGGARRALLGHDGRRSGPEIEAQLARGLSAAGFEVTSCGLTTTPGLALLTRLSDVALGVMVSASHNPAADNGIKVFDGSGGKLADELEDRIQERAEAGRTPAGEPRPPRVDPQLEHRYLDHLARAAAGLDLRTKSIVVDCANGGGSRVAPALLTRLGARVTPLAASPDGDNINRDCGSTHPAALQRAVLETGADLGLALDGDGDRCLLVDERGRAVDGDALLMVLALDARARGELPHSRMVATVMSNRGLHRALSAAGIGICTVGVGDRRVVEALRAEGLELGGEQSGHVVFGRANHYIGDGSLTALHALRALSGHGGRLSELCGSFEALPQVLVNTAVARKTPFEQLPEITAAVAEIERELGQEGRVLLRYSGTEALARVMVEGPDPTRIRQLAESLAARIAARLTP
jgi:phosphoglucosamine mutase